MDSRYLHLTGIAALLLATACVHDGRPRFDAEFRCGSMYESPIVGLGQVYLSGSIFIDGDPGSVFSNTYVYMDGYVSMPGDVVSGGTISAADYHAIGGSRIQYAPTVTAPDPTADVDAAAASNNNANIPCIPSGSGCNSPVIGGVLTLMNEDDLTLPAGVYHFNGIFVDGSARLGTSGPVTIYLDGGGAFNGATAASTITVISKTTGTIEFNGYSQVNIDLYAPFATVLFTGDNGYYGTVVGNDVRFTGGAGLNGSGDAISKWFTCPGSGSTSDGGSSSSDGGGESTTMPDEMLPDLPS